MNTDYLKFILGICLSASMCKISAGESVRESNDSVDNGLLANIQKIALELDPPYDNLKNSGKKLLTHSVYVSPDFRKQAAQVKDTLSKAGIADLSSLKGFSPLHFASLVGDAESIRTLISAGADVDAHLEYLMWTPLHFAVLVNHTSSVQALLSYGADSNKDAIFKKTSPFHLALLIANRAVLDEMADDQESRIGNPCMFSLVKQALDMGSCEAVKLVFDRKCAGENALHYAVKYADKQLIKKLLNCSVTIDARTECYETALHISSAECDLEIMNLLIDSGAQVDARTTPGLLPIHFAIHYHNMWKDNTRCVEQLILRGPASNRDPIPIQVHPGECGFFDFYAFNKAYREPRDIKNVRPRWFAAMDNCNSCMTCFDFQGLNALHLALLHGHMEIVRMLHSHNFASNYHKELLISPFSTIDAHSCKAESLNFDECAEDNWKTGLINAMSHSFMTDEAIAHKYCGSEATELLRCIEGGHNRYFKEVYEATAVSFFIVLTVPCIYFFYKATVASCSLAFSLILKTGFSLAVLLVPSYRDQSIHQAIREGSTRFCKYLVKKNNCVNAQDENGTTPLMQCCKEGNENVFQFLLEQPEVDKNLIDRVLRGTALHWACFYNRVNLCRSLLDKGFDTNLNAGEQKDQSLLHLACRNNSAELIKLILQEKRDPNLQDREGNTPLHVACILGNTDAVKALVEENVNLDVQNSDQKTPIHCAVECSQDRYLSLFLQSRGNAIVQNLLNEEASNGPYIEIGKLLLNNNANLNAKDTEGNTPLHSVCNYDREMWYKFLVEKDADINLPNNEGETPLMVACAKGSKSVAALLLLEESLSRRARDKKMGGTALHIAARHDALHGQTEMCQLLLEQGKFNPNDYIEGMSLLHQACMKNYPKLCTLFHRVQENPNCVDKDGNTPLHYACREEHVNVVHLLLSEEKGKTVDLDAKNVIDKTPLGYALEKKNEELVKLLLDHDANIQEQDIMFGARYGHLGICKLLKKRASTALLDEIGGRLAHLVQGNDELIKLFSIYQSIEPLPEKAQPRLDTVPEQIGEAMSSSTFFNLGLQPSEPQSSGKESFQDFPHENAPDDNDLLGECVDQVSEPPQSGEVRDLVTE